MIGDEVILMEIDNVYPYDSSSVFTFTLRYTKQDSNENDESENLGGGWDK